MGKIATEQEAKTIGGGSATVTTNKCCTKTRAEELKCKVTGTYASNQLVQQSSLTASTVYCNLDIIIDTQDSVEFGQLWCTFDWGESGYKQYYLSPFTQQHYSRFAESNTGEFILNGLDFEECVCYDTDTGYDTYLSLRYYELRGPIGTEYTLIINIY